MKQTYDWWDKAGNSYQVVNNIVRVYHLTPARNVKSIKENGLLVGDKARRAICNKWTEADQFGEGRIWFDTSRNICEAYLEDYGHIAKSWVCIELAIPKRLLTQYIDSQGCANYSMCYATRTIPPDAIVSISEIGV